MAMVQYNHVRIVGIKTVVPERFVDIDDELQYFDNNPKRLVRQKKMIGYGRRYIAEPQTTVCDMAVDAARKLLKELDVDCGQIDLLVFVNQSPDYSAPADACVAHGMLGLKKDCITLDLSLGCSGWPHALMTAYAMMSGGAIKKALVLAGDLPTRYALPSNRKVAQVFGDACSATLLEYDATYDSPATFVCGTDGSGWETLICPFGGMRNPIDESVLAYTTKDEAGNPWRATDSVMKGEEVFDFTMSVVPKLISDTVAAAGWTKEEVDWYCLHQANYQILSTIADRAGIPLEKTPMETFSKYANNSTNSVVTVICDQLPGTKVDKVVACAFGIGLSWGCVALNLTRMYNGGVATYVEEKRPVPTSEKLEYYGRYFRKEIQ